MIVHKVVGPSRSVSDTTKSINYTELKESQIRNNQICMNIYNLTAEHAEIAEII
jgi:hypothetical protein